jgi:hypothetical protein
MSTTPPSNPSPAPDQEVSIPTMPPDSGPLTLESLSHYAPFQAKAIELILNTPAPNRHFKPSDAADWIRLWSEVWGKGLGPLNERGERREDSDILNNPYILPDGAPSHFNVMPKPKGLDHCWITRCDKFFVRPEYEEAEDFVLSICSVMHKYRALLIIGQRGIGLFLFYCAVQGSQVYSSGKTVFLLRLFLRRLALELPTALQITSDCALLFYEGGVKEFVDLKCASAYCDLGSEADPLGRIWALVDCNSELEAPAHIFRDGPFFVVSAASPSPARQKWSRDVRSQLFYMKPWSFSEVLQA